MRKLTATKIIFIFFAIIWILPLIWMTTLALMPNDLVQENSARLIPVGTSLQNFIGVFRHGLTLRWFLNSLIVTGVTTLIGLDFSIHGCICNFLYSFPRKAYHLSPHSRGAHGTQRGNVYSSFPSLCPVAIS